MVDKRYRFTTKPKQVKCDICSNDFDSINGQLRCSDECKAEAKRRHAKQHQKRRTLQNQRTRRDQKEKLRMVRELSNRVEADENCIAEKLLDPPSKKITSAAVKIQANRKKNNSTSNNCVGIPKSKSKHKKRLCLKCQKNFDSIGPGNRVCSTCQSQNIGLGGRETRYIRERGFVGGGDY